MFLFSPKLLGSFLACMDSYKKKSDLHGKMVHVFFVNAAACHQDDLADSEEPDKFLIANIKGEVPLSFQPYVADALNGELPKKLLEYLI